MKQNLYVIAILPGLVVGILNGLYWKKQGYDFFRYAFLGSIVAYIAILKTLDYFMN